MVAAFLQDLLHASHAADCPEVIVMAMVPPWDEIKAVVESSWAMDHITYLHGDYLSACVCLLACVSVRTLSKV